MKPKTINMRKVILSMQMSLDGFIEGPNGAMDWLAQDDDDGWENIFHELTSVDAFLLGGGMYPEYAKYWAAALTNPSSPKNENKYARIAEKTQHIVISSTLSKVDPVGQGKTRIVKENFAEEIRQMKEGPGKNMLIWGGAMMASTFVNLRLVDEYRLVVNPIVLGGGKALFNNLKQKYTLKLLETKPLKSGAVILRYQSA